MRHCWFLSALTGMAQSIVVRFSPVDRDGAEYCCVFFVR